MKNINDLPCECFEHHISNKCPYHTELKKYFEKKRMKCRIKGCDQNCNIDYEFCPVHSAQFDYWKENEERKLVKTGKYWISPEGREELRDIFGDDTECSTMVLLNELERVEKELYEFKRRPGNY